MTVLLLTVAGFLAGFIDSIAGGGGLITFPAFLLVGLPVAEIVGTNKLVAASGASIAAYTFLQKEMTQREVLKAGLPITALGALIGASAVMSLPNAFLKPVVSVLVIAVATYCFCRPALGTVHSYVGMEGKYIRLTQLACFGIGFYDGFFGPGTGIFFTFFFIKVLGCDFLRATANTKALNWMSNVVSLVYFLSRGHVRFDLGIPMLLANMLGSYLGAHTAIAKGSRFIKWVYLVMALLTALKLIIDLV